MIGPTLAEFRMKTLVEKSEHDLVQVGAWIRNWRELGPILEAIRHGEMRQTDTVAALEVLDEMFTHAVQTLGPRPSSGLIHQQAVFARARP